MMTEFSTLLESNFYDGLGFSKYYFYVCLICNADKECRRSLKGDGFVGSKFSDEKECQKWNSYLVQDAIAKDGYMTQTSANLDNNSCRNPLLHRAFEDGSIEVRQEDEPWCYSLSSGIAKKTVCNVPFCGEDESQVLNFTSLIWSHFNFFRFNLLILKSLLIIELNSKISILSAIQKDG